MYPEENINREYVIVLKEDNGYLGKADITIKKPKQLIEELNSISERSSLTVLEMQTIFMKQYPKSEYLKNYIHPHYYKDTYVYGTEYPETYKYSDLSKTWQEVASNAYEYYKKHCEKNKILPQNKKIEEVKKNAVDDLKKEQKSSFLKQALEWIDACCYGDTVDEIEKDKTIVMYSKENIGWSKFSYKINEDINVELMTNFAYGSASYFLLAVKYKGIALLPYSYLVTYYYANTKDIIRCTQHYDTRRESWNHAFKFIANFVNDSISDPEKFIKNWVMNEVEKMTEGLEKTFRDSKSTIDEIETHKANVYTINVRHMFSEDKRRMEAYPSEMCLLYKVEKIVGALDFLDSLTDISTIVNGVQPHIDKIIDLNRKLYPEIIKASTKIEQQISELINRKDKLCKEIEKAEEIVKMYESKIKEIKKALNEGEDFDYESFNIKHPEFSENKKNLEKYSSELSKLKISISDRTRFLDMLNKSKEILENMDLAA